MCHGGLTDGTTSVVHNPVRSCLETYWKRRELGKTTGGYLEFSALQVLSERRCTLSPSGSFWGHSCVQLQHKTKFPGCSSPSWIMLDEGQLWGSWDMVLPQPRGSECPTHTGNSCWTEITVTEAGGGFQLAKSLKAKGQ